MLKWFKDLAFSKFKKPNFTHEILIPLDRDPIIMRME